MYTRYLLPNTYSNPVQEALSEIVVNHLKDGLAVIDPASVYVFSGRTLVRSTDGLLRCTQILGDTCNPSNLSHLSEILALYQVGAIEWCVYRDWLKYTRELEEIRKKRQAARDIQAASELLGFKPTRAMQRAIDAAHKPDHLLTHSMEGK